VIGPQGGNSRYVSDTVNQSVSKTTYHFFSGLKSFIVFYLSGASPVKFWPVFFIFGRLLKKI